jgi:hypothetical protein
MILIPFISFTYDPPPTSPRFRIRIGALYNNTLSLNRSVHTLDFFLQSWRKWGFYEHHREKHVAWRLLVALRCVSFRAKSNCILVVLLLIMRCIGGHKSHIDS